MKLFLLFATLLMAMTAESAQVRIPAGSFRALFAKPNEAAQTILAFQLDEIPVTNADFFEFVQTHPQWSRGQIKSVFADNNYLAHWATNDHGQLAPLASEQQIPVTHVSWFAARAYCTAEGKRLATTAEWEFVAMADEHTPDARRDTNFQSKILAWYSTAKPLSEVGTTPANIYGARDLHGLIWEWTADFNAVLSTGESRGDATNDNQFFCGGGALGAANPSEYASFMRYALRASLQANYTLNNLGFRCAQ